MTVLALSETRIWTILGWTMLHHLWIGAILGIVALVVRSCVTKLRSNVRYWLSLAFLAAIAIVPVAISLPVVESTGGTFVSPPHTSDTGPTVSIGSVRATQQTAGNQPMPLGFWLRNEVARVVSYLPWIWLVGAPLTFSLLICGVVGTERLRRHSQLLHDGPVVEKCMQLARKTCVSQSVMVGVCERVAGPMLIGVLRPLILLPPAALSGWTPDELEMVLLHELAHVRRLDNAVNLLQRIVEALFFYQPFVWFVSSWVRQEREHCCDEVVVRTVGNRQTYAELLARLTSQSVCSDCPPFWARATATGSALGRSNLLHRIRRIMGRELESIGESSNTVRNNSAKGGGTMFHGRRLIVLCFLLVVGCTIVIATGLAGRLVDAVGGVVVPKVEAVAFLEVRRAPIASGDALPGKSTDKAYEIFRETQKQLLRGPFVIAAALRMPGIAGLPMLADKDKPVEWLMDELNVVTSPESQILAVRLKGPDATQVKKVVDAVVEAYLQQIVQVGREEQLQSKNDLERDYARQREFVEEKEARLAERARKLGAVGASIESVQRKLAMRNIESLERSMESLRASLLELNSKLKVEQQLGPAEGASSDGQSNRALRDLEIRKEVVVAALKETRKTHAEQAAELIQAEQSAATLVVEQEELGNLKELLKETQAKIRRMEVILNGPPRVRVLQHAKCPL